MLLDEYLKRDVKNMAIETDSVQFVDNKPKFVTSFA